MKQSDITRAITAATSIAASLGLPTTDAVILRNSNKLALRLIPCDVFARVAPVGQEVAQFEIELAQRLAGIGCPVCPLEPRVDPRVYTREIDIFSHLYLISDQNTLTIGVPAVCPQINSHDAACNAPICPVP